MVLMLIHYLGFKHIAVRIGFARATLQVLQLRATGLLTAGLPCHSFIFLNRATSKRSKTRPLGDQMKAYIQIANM